MKIVYVGPFREISFQGIACKQGDPISFPDGVAKRALEQDCWVELGDTQPKAPATREDDPSTPTFREDTGEFVNTTTEATATTTEGA